MDVRLRCGQSYAQLGWAGLLFLSFEWKSSHGTQRNRQQLGGSYSHYRARVAQIFKESVSKEQGGYMNLFRGLTPVRFSE